MNEASARGTATSGSVALLGGPLGSFMRARIIAIVVDAPVDDLSAEPWQRCTHANGVEARDCVSRTSDTGRLFAMQSLAPRLWQGEDNSISLLSRSLI